ncbi:hypothetical protein [Oscillibacter sp.]|uniref:hypothetical protein n=1 Tax=Oscillibacter sp. TaxID=1945593 RepID=UPI0028AABDD5|nr:hypothetical protein [Oscillibacter sp.]
MNDFTDRELLQKQRQSKVLRLRWLDWVKTLASRPWMMVPFFVLCGAFALVWGLRKKFILILNCNALLARVYYYGLSLLLISVFVLFLVTLMVILSTPRNAKKVSAALFQIGLVSYAGTPPELISHIRIRHSDVHQWTFFSLGLSKSTWEKRREDVEDALNFCVVDIRYGGRGERNRNLIVLRAVPGIGGSRREVLYDEEI